MIGKQNVLPPTKEFLKEITKNKSISNEYASVYSEFKEIFRNFMYTVGYNDLYSFSKLPDNFGHS